MPRRPAFAAILFVLTGAGLALPGPPSVSKVNDALSPGGEPASPAARARILARHGEWSLAWDALRAAGADAPDDFSIAVLTRLGRVAEAESVIARSLPLGDDRGDGFFRRLQEARLLLDAGRYGAVLSTLEPIDGVDNGVFGAYRDVVAADALLALGRADRADAALERARREGLPEALRPSFAEKRAVVLRTLGRFRDALAAADEAVDASPDAALRLGAMRLRYDVAVDGGERSEVERAARAVFDGARRSPEAESCARDFVARALAGEPSTDVLLSCAQVFQARACRDELRSVLRVLDGRSLSAPQSELHRLLWGEYHFTNGDYSRAIALARPSYGGPELRRRSTLLLARSLRRVGRDRDAAVVYEEFVNAFPNDGLAAEVLFTAATLYRESGNRAASDRVLDELRRSYPSTFHGWAAGMRRANSLDRQGRGAEAAAILEQWLTRSSRTDEAALFYLARQHTASGEAERGAALLNELKSVNPYSFYARPDVAGWSLSPVGGGRDADRRGVSLAAWLSAAELRRDNAYERVLGALASAAAPAGPDSEEGRLSLERGRRFLEAGFADWADRELEVARALGGHEAVVALRIARLYDENAMPWRSVRLYEKARAGMSWEERRTHVDDFRYLTYPLPYPSQVLDAAVSSELPAHLVYGLIREESRFEAESVSRAGAVGLMQLMPETARRVATQMDLADAGDTLGDPEVNIAIGTWYAADLLRDGKGSVAWMLAAYNAGPNAARRWIRPGATGDAAIDGVESIDYRETRGYVKRVVESANVYHDLYFGGGNAADSPR